MNKIYKVIWSHVKQCRYIRTGQSSWPDVHQRENFAISRRRPHRLHPHSRRHQRRTGSG